MKRHILLVIAICLVSLTMASNTLSFSSVSGTPQTEVEITVDLDNSDAIVALEMVLPLGEHLKYIDNSAVLAEARSNGHQISAGQVGQELRVYIYSLSLNALQGNTGKLMTFRLQLGNEPIDFALSPTLVLSDAQGKSVSSSVQTGNVTIQAPKLEILNPQIDFGHIPIRDTYTQDLLLKNVGTLPLSIENITTSNPLLIPLQTAMTIEPNQTASVAIQYEPIEHGAISEKIVVYSSAPNDNQEVTVVADPFSVNELHIGRASGIANEEVSISLSMNNMAPIVAVQCSIALPEQLEYVPNSIVVNSSRNNGHQTLATIKKYVPKPDQWDEFTCDTLVLMLFSMTNQAFNANAGEIASFKLRLNGNSGSYTLRPHDVALLTATGENMLSAAYEATVDVQSPSFNGDDHLLFGDWAITDDVVANYVIRNYGDAPLEIERVTFLSQGYRVVSPMPLQINPWEESTMQIAYAPSSEGDFTTTMNIYTNDPTNSLKAVLISGHVYEPNSLTVDGARTPEGNYQLAIALSNYTDIVALQYDIHWRSDMTTSQAAFTPTARLQNHNATVVKMNEDTYRVIIYSMVNASIIGKEGELHRLTFTPQGDVNYCDNTITIDNIVLSNVTGTDKVSQSTVLHHFPTTQYSEQTITACDEYVYNNKVYQSSGTYIDTLQSVNGCDSIIVLHLTINKRDTIHFYETACDEYYWDRNGETYYENGDYERYTTTEQGCERVEVLHLTINQSEREEYNVAACGQYEWHGNTYYESGDYEYHTTIEETTEKLYVGYDAQNDPIIGLTPPRGISRFTVDGYITDGSGWCFVGTGSPENGNVDDGGDLRIFEYEETLYYDRVWGRKGHFYGDYRNPFNIEFGNYYAKNIETGEYYFIDEENVHEYSNTEYPLTLFYGDYGKIHKVQFFDNNNLLWADINAVIQDGVPMITINYYNPDGTIYHTQQFTENLHAETKTITEQGCERVEILHLTIHHSEREEYYETACDEYWWHDNQYTESGDYEHYTTTDQGCERVEVLHLTINHSEREEYYATACNEYWWDRNGETYYESGDYEHYTTTDQGCERVEVLHLTINRSEREEYYVTACNEYWWDRNGETYYESGDYEHYTTTDQGCERVEVLHLTINRSEREEYYATACNEYWWDRNGETYYESGDYEHYTTTDQGCERVEVLHLTINRSEREEYYATACNEYWWDRNGETYYESGDYEHYTTTDQGCERVEVLHLTINHSEREEYYATACNEYWWDRNGETYYESGDYEHYTTTDQGCERVEVLHLTINHSEREEYYATACNEYWWDRNGETYYESGDYEHYTTTDQGCERVEVLHLTIHRSEREEYYATACNEYWWDRNGETYYESGDYEHYTTTDQGCERVEVLHLTINHSEREEYYATACNEYWWDRNGETYYESGDYEHYTTTDQGCERVEVLHLTINHSEREEYYATACNEYWWDRNGETYYESGDYEHYTTTDQGCERVEVLHLTTNHSEREEYYETACDEYWWDHNGETYYESGDYEHYTTTDQGCERVEVLHLTINRSEREEYWETACDEYWWDRNGETYYESGDYEHYTTTDQGCERVEVLHLTINTTQYAEETVTACDSYTWNGDTYIVSGEYTYTTTAANGCDSIVTLHLTINHTQYAEETVTACDSYTWNGETYTTSGEYTYTTTAANSCDSIIALHLTINQTQYAEEIVTACDSYTWNGETYKTSGEYTYTTTAANGCDSIVTLHLTINNTQYAEETITACDNYTWNGETYTESGEYTYTTTATNGCDSIVTLHLTINQTQYAKEIVTACDNYTWNGETYTESGEYTYTTTAANGCDSIVTLHLTINATKYAEETVTACDSYTWNGETYTESGEYTYTTTAANGCDSIVTLHLTINQSEVGNTEYATICYGETYTWNGQTYAATGEYSVTLTNAAGCDSIATLHLTIMPEAFTNTESVVIGSDELPYTWRGNTYLATGRYTDIEQYTQVDCDSAIHVLDLTVLTTGNFDEESITICETETPYMWYGESYTATGKYTYTEKYAGTDIDSVQHILNLTINPTKYAKETVTACDNYIWNGEIYTTSGEYTYTTTAANGCDSIVTLHLTINVTKYTEETITACDNYTWNGETYTESGNYTYTTTAANGCDSIVTLHLTINHTQYAEETVIACDSYTWNGETYIESGEYTYTTTAANGCDSIVTLHLTINHTQYAEEIVTACDSYIWNGETYTTSGEYVYTTVASNGCDSIVTLHLTINQSEVGDTEYATICYGETYTWNGQTYAATGEYSVTLTNAAGCDSIATLHLTIMPEAFTNTETVVIGSDELPYTWRGNTYLATGRYTDIEQYTQVDCDSAIHVLDLTVLTTGNFNEESITICETETPYIWYGESYAATGKYTYTEKYAGTDIDSVQHILNLTVNPTKYAEETVIACDSYIWNGETYTTSGEYTYTTTAANGCDSIVTLHLTINQTQYAEEIVTACDSYTWNGETYTTSGEYTYTTTAANGCDSIVTLHLTINQTQYAKETVTACDNYTWNGETYTESGNYTYTTTATNGCDSIVTLHLTINATKYAEETVTACDNYIWNGETYTTSGEYTYTTTAANGCDSIVTLHLTINHTQYAEETITACDSYVWNDETYTASGEYTYTTVASNGCDSIVTLHLTINQSEVGDTEYATICYGETYIWNAQTYAVAGEYSVTLTNAAGCDSIATLHLTIMPEAVTSTETVVIGSDELPYTWRGNTYLATGRYIDVEQYTQVDCDSAIHVLDLTVLTTGNFDEESITICETETPYMWYGESYTATGKYTYTEKYTGTDIDSVQHILNLTVNPIKYTEETITACDSYTWNGKTYTASGEYTYNTTAANGCDSIITLHLTINVTKYAEETVTACDSYTWNGETYTESGEYTYTTTAANGCDSIVTLHLTINNTQYAEETITACDSYVWNDETYTASGEYTYTTTAANGCDSIVTLHLTINQTQYAEEIVTACDTYTWNSETYTTSGDYVYTTVASNGCDSIVTLHLTINQSEVGDTEYATICYGETYTWNGQTYAVAGEYSVTLTNAAGCDSIATLHLTIMPEAVTSTETVVIGSDELPYTWRGNTYLATGRYTDIEQYTQVDCDSAIHVLDLTVLTTGNFDEESITICETETPYMWYGESYTATGKYTYTEKYTGTDIDSVQHILNLTVNPIKYTEETITACDSYTWNGETYTESGDYTYTTTAANGCDSIVTLHLTINATKYAEETVTACDNYTWNGETYTESGEYTYTTTATNGCDSIITLHLTINVTKYTEETITACDSYTWNGEPYTESGEYTYTTTAANGCDSIVTLHLTINKSEREEFYETACNEFYWDHNGETYYESGDYEYYTTTDQGCERVEVLHLTILPDATTESETLTLCQSELPYEWYGQTLTEAGSYTATEPYAGMECDSVIHELTLNVYVQTLPATVTLPIVRMGEAIDVTIPTTEIQAHIAAETWYAPNVLVAWYILENSDWASLTDEPITAGIEEVTLKYAVETDCGIAESDKMVIAVETTGLENILTDVMGVYKVLRDNKIFIIRDDKMYSIMGQEVRK